MDNPMLVGILEGPGSLYRDPKRVIDRELALAGEPVPEALTLHVGHGEPELACRLARVEHGEDVGVL
jgi:hypothetical protein